MTRAGWIAAIAGSLCLAGVVFSCAPAEQQVATKDVKAVVRGIDAYCDARAKAAEALDLGAAGAK